MNPFRIRHFNHTPRLKIEHPGNESKCTMIGPSEAGLFLGSFKTSSVSILESLASMIISTLIVSSRISSSFLQLLLSHHKLCLTDNINANTDLVNTPLVSKFQTSEFPFFSSFFLYTSRTVNPFQGRTWASKRVQRVLLRLAQRRKRDE